MSSATGCSSIQEVLFCDGENQLIALEGTHRRVRVWDIRMQRSLGEIQELETNDSAFLSMLYDRCGWKEGRRMNSCGSVHVNARSFHARVIVYDLVYA